MKKSARQIAPPDIDSLIAAVRGQKVILDADLARIYHVPTKALNQAVKRNREKFPEDFLFQLTPDEAEEVCNSTPPPASSQAPPISPRIVTGSLRSQIVTSNRGRGGRRYLPYAFTEHGAIMAANVLNSPQATQMSVFVDPPPPPPDPPPPEIGFHVKEDAIPYRTRRKPRLPIHSS